jgi:apolipoprotein N-acyltransferase
VFSTEKFSAAPLICFEDVFPGVARKSSRDDLDFLVNLTNDGWFSESAEQWQHLANAVFRAVENGLPLVRAANNGITCWIDEHGRVQNIFRATNGSEYGPGVMMFEIPLRPAAEKQDSTFYHRHGDWFGWGCAVIAIASLFGKIRKRRRP